MLGYAAGEVMNKITPADISDPQELIARAEALSVELGTPITPGFEALVFKASRGIEDIYELTYIRKDGTRFPALVSVTALRDAQDAIIGYLLIGTDNTARKEAEEALLQAGALQNAIFNSANFSSIATDAKGVIQIFNVGAERMLGYTAAEVMNKITPADISDPLEVIARAGELSVELGTPITPGFEALVFKASRGIEDIYELTYIRKDGTRFPAVVNVTALRDAQDAIIGYLLIGTDNTARKQAEEALLQAGALQNAIFNSANFSSIATDAKGVIQIFNVGAERMLGYEAGEVMNKITPAEISDPQEMIALVVQDDASSAKVLRQQLELQGFTVVHASSADAGIALALQHRLALITVDILLSGMDGWEFLSRLEQMPALARIPVVIISSAAEHDRGVSLGAAAVLQKSVAREELHESLVELGLFPTPQGQQLKVLVVDDDPNAVELVAVRIESLDGTQVHRAYGGREAIEIARREVPSLIVLDLVLPDVDGFDVVRALNQHEDTARIPILVMTAQHITDVERAGIDRDVGATHAFDGELFTSEVRRAMNGRSS